MKFPESPERRFAREVTRGLWVAPRRRREAEREILDHLEDLAEEERIEFWSREAIERRFGPAAKLKTIYRKGGLPMWAKFAKWGLWGLAFVFLIGVTLNFYALWFYPVDPSWIEAYKTNQSFFDMIDPQGGSVRHELDIQWLGPDDGEAAETLVLLERSLAAYDEYLEATNRAHSEFYARPDIQEKIKDAKPLQPPGGMGGYGGTTFGMGMDFEAELTDGEKAELEDFKESASEEAFEKLVNAWTQVESGDELRFERPEVTPDDHKLFEEAIRNAADNPQTMVRRQQDTPWLGVAVGLARMDPSADAGELIQYAKDLMSRTGFYLKLQGIYSALRDRCGDCPPERAAEIARASAVWCRLYLKAVNPNPEPLFDALIVTAQGGIVREMLGDHVNRPGDIPAFEGAMREFKSIPYGEVMGNWPDFGRLSNPEGGIASGIAATFGQFSFFRAQCSLMQNFCAPGSDAYFRYELLKRGLFLYMMRIALPNFENAQTRIETVMGGQALAEGWLILHENGMEAPEGFFVADPFQPDGIRYTETETRLELRGAGPDGEFGGAAYSPSNGMRSRGDLAWELIRE